MYKKIILISVIAFNFFIPVLVNAEVGGANSQIPALNPFCWKKKDCVDVRRGFVRGDPTDEELAKNGFISNSSVAPCNSGTGDEQWGRCLPAGVTKTEIDFGGRSEFSNVGDFILFMYKWLVTIASILAVIMIIVSGVQWITSGGNSESISSAKSRISGAVIGLFIAYMSYFILNTINPNLVNFRLPQVWLVRPQSLMPEFCSDIPDYKNIKFAYVFQNGNEGQPLPPAKTISYVQKEDKDLSCGGGFLAENGGVSPCTGQFCDKIEGDTHMCISMSDAGHNEKPGFGCVKGDLLVQMSAQSDIEDAVKDAAEDVPLVNLFVGKPLEDNWVNTLSPVVRAVCKLPSGELFLANSGNGTDLVTFKSLIGERTPLSQEVGSDTKRGSLYPNYTFIYSGLSDPDIINKSFTCYHSIVTKEVAGTKFFETRKEGEIVGYFLRYEIQVNRVWAEEWVPTIKDAAIGAGTGATVGGLVGWLGGPIGAGAGTVIGGAAGWAVGLISDPGDPKPNLNVGYNSGTQQAIYGLYASPVLRQQKPAYERIATIKSLASYIPLEKLRGPTGLRLKINFSISDLARIMVNRSSVPRNDQEYFWQNTTAPTPATSP